MEPKPCCLNAQADYINRFVRSLGNSMATKYENELDDVPQNDTTPSTPVNATSDHGIVVSIPSLSLEGSSKVQHKYHSSEKHHLEEHAAKQLSTLLVIVVENSHKLSDRGTETGVEQPSDTHVDGRVRSHVTNNLNDIPGLLVANLKNTVGVLIDARLRAYIAILARHGVSIAACPGLQAKEQEEGILMVERKIALLIETRRCTKVLKMSTSFQVVNETVSFEMTMDFSVPSSGPSPSMISFKAKTSGDISAVFDDDHLKSITIHLDCLTLLSQLVDGAAKVMTMTLDNVKTIMTHPINLPHATSKEEPTVDIPSAKPPTAPTAVGQTLPVVSPDLGARMSSAADSVSDFVLEGDVEDVYLSPERCASIVDCVFDNIDNDIICPNSKRRKLLS